MAGGRESHEPSPGLQTRYGLRGFISRRKRGFPLMAALMFVLVMAIFVSVLVAMHPGFMAVLMPVVGMGV
jgi:hypothetical protein